MSTDLLNLRVDAIKWELKDTATLYLTELYGDKVQYQAGQFITLVFDHHEHEIRRSYSLSSSPDEDRLTITVKRISNGEISRFLLTKVRVGDILKAVKPAGVFTIKAPDEQKDIIYFAAGSGITPVFSQLKYILSRPGQSKLHVINSAQSDQSVIFKNELNELCAKYPERLNVIYLLSNKGKRLTNQVVERYVNQEITYARDKAEFYLCGPFDYMRMIRLTLLYMGLNTRQIHKENFVLETIPVTGSLINYPPQSISITYNGDVHDINQGENQSILQAALQNNLKLPYSCRSGMCSACVAFCKSGRVEMAKNEVLTDDDIAKGWILTCTGHAVTPGVVIEYPER